MEFRKYQHIERFGTDEVENINIGKCYIFPKIDGTNSSCWLNADGELRCGSRNRELTLEKDNAGFYAAMLKNENIINYLKAHPNHRLFGEWLVPHTLKTYRADAWRKFYVFDVAIDNDELERGLEYIPYDIYAPMLEEFGIEYIAPLRIVKNGDYEYFVHCLEVNDYLIEDGKGVGEGIVIKNYDFYNRYGRQTWAKIVRAEFKEKNRRVMGAPETEKIMFEEKIADQYVTEAMVHKEYDKIRVECNGWSSKYIPRLLNTVFHVLIEEEMWHILKEYKNPTINFKTLNTFVIGKIKRVMPELFN